MSGHIDEEKSLEASLRALEEKWRKHNEGLELVNTIFQDLRRSIAGLSLALAQLQQRAEPNSGDEK